MNINTRAKALIGAVAIGGAAIAMGGAFTAGGLTAEGDAANSAFIGGSVDQNIDGATISSVVYDVNEAENKIVSVALTFGDGTADGKKPVITFTGTGVTGTYDCSVVDVETNLSSCTATTQADNTMSSLDITVA